MTAADSEAVRLVSDWTHRLGLGKDTTPEGKQEIAETIETLPPDVAFACREFFEEALARQEKRGKFPSID